MKNILFIISKRRRERKLLLTNLKMLLLRFLLKDN